MILHEFLHMSDSEQHRRIRMVDYGKFPRGFPGFGSPIFLHSFAINRQSNPRIMDFDRSLLWEAVPRTITASALRILP
jgi:hypothetical protein